jgi:hypothetical protein
VQTLIAHDLVDALRMMGDPLVVGGGKWSFRDDGALRPLRLVDHKVTTTGAILATYAAADSWAGVRMRQLPNAGWGTWLARLAER